MLGAAAAGDIWSTGAFSFESPLKDLLDTDNYTLEQLLAEDELLQELRGLHPQLLSFFSSPDVVRQLVHYVTAPPAKTTLRGPSEWMQAEDRTAEQDEMKHIRFPYMSCEIICCELDQVIDVLVDGVVGEGEESTRILDGLFAVLYDTKTGELDDCRAGYLDKILTVLFRRRRDDMSAYMNSEGLMAAVFRHLYSHSIMQVAQRLMIPPRPVPPPPPESEDGAEIVPEEGIIPDEDPGSMSDWHESRAALDLLLKILVDPEVEGEPDEDKLLDASLHASEVLITVIQNSLLSSEVMLSLTSQEIISRIVAAASTPRGDYFSPHESLLTSAMNVLESLILQLGGYGAVGTMFIIDENDEPQEQPLIADLQSLVNSLPTLLDAMSQLLRHPSTQSWKSPTQYSTKEPQPLLGCSRLRIVRVLESLVLLGDPDIDAQLVQSDSLRICLDLFWEFQWCSMLHQSVANLLVHVFEGQNGRFEMQQYFLMNCNLLERMMDSFGEAVVDTATPSSDNEVSAMTGSGELVVSEDDVDAAMEDAEDKAANAEELQTMEDIVQDKDTTEEVAEEKSSPDETQTDEPTEAPPTEDGALENEGISTPAVPAQAFRFGYMGHVIIICQALVHASVNDVGIEENENLDEENPVEPEPLLMAELLATHELASRWHDFIATTLAAETEIQSTHLGGYLAGETPPMQLGDAQRPGLADDGDMGDDGMGPPAPPRGMVGGGDALDLDENDLDIAANMMTRLALQRPTTDNDSSSSGESGDSDKSYNSGETASERTGYAFDDPLGRAGALGIELGKLTQYSNNLTAPPPAASDDFSSSSSSSDEEPELTEPSAEDTTPVMDLFAGNFDYSTTETTPQETEMEDFANFDSADTEFGEFVEARPKTEDEATEDLFQNTDHPILDSMATNEVDESGNEEKAMPENGEHEKVAADDMQDAPEVPAVVPESGTNGEAAVGEEATTSNATPSTEDSPDTVKEATTTESNESVTDNAPLEPTEIEKTDKADDAKEFLV